MAPRHELFEAANRELGIFAERLQQLVRGRDNVDAAEWSAVRRLVTALGPDVAEASRYSSLDELLRAQLTLYAQNLRTIEASLNQVQCVMLARRASMEAARRHVDRLRGWVDAYRRTSPGAER